MAHFNWLHLVLQDVGSGLGFRRRTNETGANSSRRRRSGRHDRSASGRSLDDGDECVSDEEGEEEEEEEEEEEDFDYIPYQYDDFDEEVDCESSRSDITDDLDNPERSPEMQSFAQRIRYRTAACSASVQFGKVHHGQAVNSYFMLAGREVNISRTSKFSQAERCHLTCKYLPLHGPRVMAEMGSRAYTGQFSDDGSLFVAGFQDRRIIIYNLEKEWEVQKDVICRNLRWTVTDTALSPDQRFLVYASIHPIVYLVNVGNESGGVQSLANITDIHEGLDLSYDPTSGAAFGIWSLQFSHDGREILAGASDQCIYGYDLEAQRNLFRVDGHKDDVNAVVFADNACNVIFSGSDDSTCKVWDKRCLSTRGKATGILEGHLEGITCLDTFGDGQHFISNSKDQTLKLWDIRKMVSNIPRRRSLKVPKYNWDYRWGDYPGRGKNVKHPYDMSIMTYKGHRVLKTLIRCYFSPASSTGQRFIYTGSADGRIYIFDMVTGKLHAKLMYHKGAVRDVSWHPQQSVLVSSSFDGEVAKWVFSPDEVAPPPSRAFRRMDDEFDFDSD